MAGMTLEERRAEQREREQAKLDEMRQRHPTNIEHPHLMTISLHAGAALAVVCPGRAHCGLWYGTEVENGRCGVQVEVEEVGSEFLEWQVGPAFEVPSKAFPIGFTWSGGGQDDPPEIEWWPL